MIIDLTKLHSNIVHEIFFNENIDISKEFLNKYGILDLKNTIIEGSISKNIEYHYIDANLSGIMTLPNSLTLEPTDISFETEISGNIEELLEEIGKNDKKIENTIDIFPIIWENILMEIPIRVECEESRNVVLKGDNWKVITDDSTSDFNPELQKLKDLLK